MSQVLIYTARNLDGGVGTVSAEYEAAALAVISLQLRKAAVRLAAMLEPDSKLGLRMTGPCQPANHETDRGYENPCLGAGDGRLEILGKSSASSEPRESALDDPSPREHLEPFGCIRPFDDFNGPCAEIGQRPRQLFSSVSAVSEEMAQPRVKLANGGDDAHRAVSILDVGSMHGQSDQVAVGICDDLAFTAFNLLAGVVATGTSNIYGFGRLAIDDACGRTGLAPNAMRATATKWKMIVRQRPLSRQA